MRLYLAGSFPHLTSFKKEKSLKECIESQGRTYNRLVSFYYPKTVETVLKVREEHGKKNGED
jgi:hypothetical protein